MSFYNNNNGNGNNRSHRRNGFNNSNNDGFNNRNSLSDRIDSGSSNSPRVEVRQWQGGSRDNLVDFIHRKSRISLQNVRVSGPVLHATIRQDESTVLAKLSGIRFAGSPLDIRVYGADGNSINHSHSHGSSSSSGSTSNVSAETRSTIQLLKEYIFSHYNADIKFLNLENMAGDQFLISNGLFSSASTTSKFFPALMKITSDSLTDLESVSLASNGLLDVSAVTTLAATFSRLKNLSLANNNISHPSGLDLWRHKFPQLRELILSGNPISATPTYKDDMIKLFPKLIVLDGQIIQDESLVGLIKLPLPINHNFFENAQLQNIAGPFLATFFDLYDQDRSQLMPLYDEQSTFSVSVNSNAPRQIGGANNSSSASSHGNWNAYIPISRNLYKITSTQARISRLSLGPQAIGTTFQKLPPTKHDLKAPERFSVDVWSISGVRVPGDQGMMISIHGEYFEQDNTLHSFDRSLVVLPGPSGNMIVTSDMLTVRPYSGYDGWGEAVIKPFKSSHTIPTGPAATQPSQPQNAAGSTRTIVDVEAIKDLTPSQQLVVRTLQEKTRLTTAYARMCAEQAQYNLQNALALFEQSQANNLIPPEGFLA